MGLNRVITFLLLLLYSDLAFAQSNPLIDTSTLKQKIFEPLHSTIVLSHDTIISFNQTYHWIGGEVAPDVIIERNFQTRKYGFFNQQLTGETWNRSQVILTDIPYADLGLARYKNSNYHGWTDTIPGFEIRYNYEYMESILVPMGLRNQLPRTLYRYWDCAPILTLTSNLFVVEGIAPYKEKAYVGYWDNNHQGMDESDSNIIGKITFVTGLDLSEPPLQKQIVRVQTRFDFDDRGAEEEAGIVNFTAIWLEVVTSSHDPLEEYHNSRSANFEERWLDADKRDFTLVLKCRGKINETHRIPVHNGKLDISHLHSKYFKFSFE